MKRYFILSFLLGLFFCATAQDSSRLQKALSFPDKLLISLHKKSEVFETKLDKQTTKYLNKLEKQESRLKRKLSKKDSLLARELFADATNKYQSLKKVPEDVSKFSGVYSGHLDSLNTALHFLDGENLGSSEQLQKVLSNYSSLQGRLNQTDAVKKYLKQRSSLLKEQLTKLGMVKGLKKYQKGVYYYGQQVREYKQAFEDPTRLEQKLMEALVKLPEFRSFFAKNSQLSSLFRLPGSDPTPSAVNFTGLQTRTSLNQLLQDRLGTNANAQSLFQQNTQSAQRQLQQLKDKAAKYSSGSYGNGSEDIEMPDFKSNTQKTKSFLQRLEYGGNWQSQKARSYFPVTSELGLSLGYKLSDKSVVGVGASYKLGLGKGWNHMTLSHQGVGLRSYIDYKIKGSFFLSGGYEQNYRTLFTSLDQLKDYSAWQSSGLIGLSKKYKVSKKMKGEMKLLWDFLSYQQMPRTQAILFRVGYSLK